MPPSDERSALGPEWHACARRIHLSGRRLVIAVTGGGSGALGALLQTPGASRSILEAVVPYSWPALVEWLGGKPDQACSAATARAMAMAAFVRARRLAPEADPATLVGVGCTASLATDRPKRGERRVYVAVQGADATEVASLSLADAPPARPEDERAAAVLLLDAIAQACGIDDRPAISHDPPGQRSERLRRQREVAASAWSELLLGRRRLALVPPGSTGEPLPEAAAPAPRLVFPGAFHPPHSGHLRMAEIAEGRVGTPAMWELSTTNVDKPPLDFISIRERVEGLRRADPRRLIALTTAPTFVEKSQLFSGATFVVGADTIARIAQPRYYGGEESRRDAAIDRIGGQGCRFLVFGRTIDGQFQSLDDLHLPAALRRICDAVPAEEFREDVSSTELRRQAADGP